MMINKICKIMSIIDVDNYLFFLVLPSLNNGYFFKYLSKFFPFFPLICAHYYYY